MTMTACLDCGEPSAGPRCPEHTTDTKPSAAQRGYDHRWNMLSKRARRLQPFCLDCGATDDLQTDHTPEAWAAKAAGKPITLDLIEVVCGPCNRARGAVRGSQATRGPTPTAGATDPSPRQSLSHTPLGGMRC